MRMYELIVMGSMLVLCGAGLVWLIVDMNKQLKAYAERCESEEE